MANLNFGSTFNGDSKNLVAQSNHLEADKIHIVKVREAKEEVIKTKDGKEIDTLVVVFEDENGRIFEDKTLELTQESVERKPNAWGGVNASIFDSVTLKFRCYIANFAPKYNEKLLKGEVVLDMKTWKQFKDNMKSLLNAVAKLKTPVWCKLKLVDNKGFASLPFFASVNKDGDAYISNNFIGNVEHLKEQKRDITFSAAEMKKIQARLNGTTAATPTSDLPTLDEDSPSTDINEEDFNDIDI